MQKAKRNTRNKHISPLVFIFDFLMCVYRICDAYEAFQMGDYPAAIFKILAAITKLISMLGALSKKPR